MYCRRGRIDKNHLEPVGELPYDVTQTIKAKRERMMGLAKLRRRDATCVHPASHGRHIGVIRIAVIAPLIANDKPISALTDTDPGFTVTHIAEFNRRVLSSRLHRRLDR